jgi:hypothetical protein
MCSTSNIFEGFLVHTPRALFHKKISIIELKYFSISLNGANGVMKFILLIVLAIILAWQAFLRLFDTLTAFNNGYWGTGLFLAGVDSSSKCTTLGGG